jgi:hypothetical protein
MNSRRYDVKVRVDSVDATWESPYRSAFIRVLSSIAIAVPAAAWVYYAVFRPHDGYSLWWVLRYDRARDFIEAAAATLFHLVLSGGALALGVRSLFPSGEKLHCDHSQLTVSKIPWLSFRGRWLTRVFSLADISQMEYGILQRGTASNPSIYGLRFLANGRAQKALSRLEAPEASHLLRGLEGLGVDVRHDPDMLARIQETLGERRIRRRELL